MIHEFANRLDVVTPQGPGSIWFVTQFGHETSLVFCVIQDNGTLWEWQPCDIKVKDNQTFNRTQPKNLNHGKTKESSSKSSAR